MESMKYRYFRLFTPILSKMEITENNDHCKNCNCYLMSWEKTTCRKFRPIHSVVSQKNRNSRFILSCCKFCNSCRLFSFWKQSVVRNNRTTNGGIFQNGNNHSKQQLFPFGNIVFMLPRKPRQLRVQYVLYDKCSIH